MLKVLVIGVFKDGTGWGQAAINYALALDSVGVDVVCRHIKLNKRNYNPPERIVELENKSLSGVTHCIQVLLPFQTCYESKFKNINLIFTETDNFLYSSWPEYLKTMDQVWVCNEQSKQACYESGIENVSVVNMPCDIEKYQQSYPKLDISDNFKFYFIGEYSRRKNILALVKAFLLEFSPEEPVDLVIKTSHENMSGEECNLVLEKEINFLKKSLKIKRSRQPIIITKRLTDQQINSLHNTCDCFVMPSFGEAWSIPTFDSMGFGRTPIATACTGFLDYISINEGWLVSCREEPVLGVDEHREIFTRFENWFSIDVNHLRACMRSAYFNEKLRETKSLNCIEKTNRYSYESIGLQMVKLLENA